jgi:competence protein ComEA
LGGSGAMLYAAHHAAAPAVIITPPPDPAEAVLPVPPSSSSALRSPAAVQKAAPARVYVHVAGAVKHPWLYEVPSGSRVLQAILAAGGPTPQADLNDINLAERVQDGEKVYVPQKQPHAAVIAQVVPPGNIIGHRSVLPAAPAETAALPTVIEPVLSASGPAPSPIKHHSSSKADKITSAAQGQINLNTADASELMRLPDVGPAMAARIIAYRTQSHGFQSIAELQQVGGIGPKKFAKISPLVTLSGQ